MGCKFPENGDGDREFLEAVEVVEMVNGDGINVFKEDVLRARSLKGEVMDGGWGDSDVFLGGREEMDRNPSWQDEALGLKPRAQLS